MRSRAVSRGRTHSLCRLRWDLKDARTFFSAIVGWTWGQGDVLRDTEHLRTLRAIRVNTHCVHVFPVVPTSPRLPAARVRLSEPVSDAQLVHLRLIRRGYEVD